MATGTRFLVIPALQLRLSDVLAAGYIQTLVEAAVIGVPGYGPCMGNHMGIILRRAR
ncbi:MAG: hypothetical protein R2851_28230 [Caldilineaceae bacterium]